MVYHEYPSRFDFDYWPPRPVKQSDRKSRPINPDDLVQLNDGTIYVHDDTRREQVKQVYCSGEYVDIEDFWLASNPPSPSALWRAKPTVYGDHKIARHYLGTSSEVFRTIVYALDGTHNYGLDDDTGDNIEFLNRVFDGPTRDERYMNHVPPVYLDKRNILVAREALAQCLDTENPLVYIKTIPRYWVDEPSKKVSIFGSAGKAFIERVLSDSKTYEDRLFPDTIPEDW